MQPLLNYFKHPNNLLDSMVLHWGQWLPDSVYISLRYHFQMGKRLNLKNPQTFSEKLQWLKLYDQNPEYTRLVDKILVKDYVAKTIGSQYVIPLLGVWNKPEDIDWDLLPNQFVLKTNHSGGNTGVVICKDKSSFDRKAAIKKMNMSLHSDVYRNRREWPYKNVERKVFAEMYIEPSIGSQDLLDYKFFCFNGVPKFCQVISGRGTRMSIDFFDSKWNHMPFHEPKSFPFAEVEPGKPVCFDEMLRLASQLAANKSFSRIDFYDVNGKVYFGEITFYPTSGMGGGDPESYDKILGAMINLPNKHHNL